MLQSIKKILIVGSTHGHERIGLAVIEELKKLNIPNDQLRFEIGNPRASEKNIPFIDSDLNRIFPGNPNGTYEERLAFELLPKIRDVDLVIDIHSTNTTDLSENSMLIVTKYDTVTRDIVGTINPPKVLVMKYKSDSALISQARIGVAFEYGKDTSESVLQATLFDIAEVLIACGFISRNPYTTTKHNERTDAFEVYDSYKKDFLGKFTLAPEIKNFQLVTQGSFLGVTDSGVEVLADESFVPILFGENRYTEILGFKAKKIAPPTKEWR